MTTYVILSRVSPEAFSDPFEFKKIAEQVAAKISAECPDVRWKDSFALNGRFDVIDIIESDDPRQVHKAALIIRSYGHSITETLEATPWNEFLNMI